ncbi:MAG: response regulator transcription factor [Lewinellaceae bacterium]|nr:response regulator transcription factor [Lewinellaceae bacterium]
MLTRALIIEDEPEGLENLKNLLRMCCPDVDVVAEGGSNADLLRLADDRSNRFDVAFLDISLPDGLVFQALQQLDEVPFDIIFVTAFDKYAIRAFEFAAIDYVTKPIEREELIRAVSRIKPRNTETKARLEVLQQTYNPNAPNAFNKIGISAMDGVHFVRLADITRLEAENNYTHFLLNGGNKITASRTIKAYEDALTSFNFVRVHKKHIVNMNFMKTYIKGEGGYLIMENGDSIEVSRRQKVNLMDALKRTHGETWK